MSKFANVIIRASAGTGKTFQLSNRYLGLLSAGAPPDEILATTFTRKAAGEILERVIGRFAEAALDEKKRETLAQFIDDPSLTHDRCVELLAQLTRHLHRLRICTLDAYFSQLAGSFGLELGLPPGWQILETVHQMKLSDEAIETLLRGNSTRVISRLMHLLTKGEADRTVSQLLRSTVNDLYGLYMVTDDEAWNHFPEQWPLSLEELAETTEKLRSVEVPEGDSFKTARNDDYEAAVAQDWKLFVKKGIAAKVAAGESMYRRKEIAPATIAVYEKLIEHAKATLIQELAQQTTATYEVLKKYDDIYRELKLERRGQRFDDITQRLAAATASGLVDQQQFRMDTRLSHLLLDEFQDTSLAQWQIIRPLAERVAASRSQETFLWAGGQTSLFCVGDVKQAIYGWRGGKSQIFEALEAHIPGLERASLTTSFRSSQPVIDVVNRLFRGVTDHPDLDDLAKPVKQWCEDFEEHATARQELPGYVQLCTCPEIGEEESEDDVLCRYTAQLVEGLTQAAPELEVGILARRNKIVARLIFELRRLGIAASEEGGNPLTDSAAVQAILSLLTLADHPGNSVAAFHVANTPLGPLLQFTDPADSNQIAELTSQVRRQLHDDGYGPTIYNWAKGLIDSCDQRELSRLQQLVELAFNYQPLATLRPTDFVLYVQNEKVGDPSAAQVRVMTIHQSKGLQFDVVVLPEMGTKLTGQPSPCVVGQPSPSEPINRVCLYRGEEIRNLLPIEYQRMFEQSRSDEVAESMCELYVAFTRAVYANYVVLAPSKANAQKLPKTAAGLVRAALIGAEKLAAEEIVYEHGDPRWFEAARQLHAAAATDDWSEMPPTAIRFADRDEPVVLAGSAASPSALEGGRHLAASRILNLSSARAMQYGTLMHRWFECIQWSDDGKIDVAVLNEVAERIEADDWDVDELVNTFYAAIGQPDVDRLLSRDFYQQPDDAGLLSAIPAGISATDLDLEVRNEQRFATLVHGQLLTGTIDRLVLMRSAGELVAADIVDYKTDAVPTPEKLEAAVAHYQPQVDAYRRAVAQMFNLSAARISARLLFLSVGTIREVPATAVPTA